MNSPPARGGALRGAGADAAAGGRGGGAALPPPFTRSIFQRCPLAAGRVSLNASGRSTNSRKLSASQVPNPIASSTALVPPGRLIASAWVLFQSRTSAYWRRSLGASHLAPSTMNTTEPPGAGFTSVYAITPPPRPPGRARVLGPAPAPRPRAAPCRRRSDRRPPALAPRASD